MDCMSLVSLLVLLLLLWPPQLQICLEVLRKDSLYIQLLFDPRYIHHRLECNYIGYDFKLVRVYVGLTSKYGINGLEFIMYEIFRYNLYRTIAYWEYLEIS